MSRVIASLAKLPLWLQWTLVTAIGLTLGEILVPGEMLFSVFSYGLVCVLHWFILRRYFAENSLWWLALTFAGWVVFNVLVRLPFMVDFLASLSLNGGDSSGIVLLGLLGALFGLCIGLAQYVILRLERVAYALLWIPVNVLAYGLGALLIGLIPTIIGGDAEGASLWISVLVPLLAGTLLIGAINGMALTYLVRQSLRFASVRDTRTYSRV